MWNFNNVTNVSISLSILTNIEFKCKKKKRQNINHIFEILLLITISREKSNWLNWLKRDYKLNVVLMQRWPLIR